MSRLNLIITTKKGIPPVAGYAPCANSFLPHATNFPIPRRCVILLLLLFSVLLLIFLLIEFYVIFRTAPSHIIFAIIDILIFLNQP